MPGGPAGLHQEGEAAVGLRKFKKAVVICMNALQN